MAAGRRRTIPEDFSSIAEATDFWDSHSVGDYRRYLKPTKLTVQLRRRVHLLALDPEIAAQLRAVSRARGLSTETVANLWLRDRLTKEAKSRKSRRAA